MTPLLSTSARQGSAARPADRDRPEIRALGTTLAVFAHPDDEAYLAGGLLAALRDEQQRVVCITATRGDAGNGLHDGGAAEARSALAAVRSDELMRSLRILGVAEHRWLDYDDTQCDSVDVGTAVGVLHRLMETIGPQTVVGFGPDGFTGHPDHLAVARWTALAVDRCRPRPRLLQAVTTRADRAACRDVDDAFQVFQYGPPPIVAESDLAVRLVLHGRDLERKTAALQAQESQTAELIAAIGVGRFARWVSTECFRADLRRPSDGDRMSEPDE